MVEEPDNLVVELLRRIRDDLGSFESEMREELGDLKLRTSAVEQGLTSIGTQINQLQVLMNSFHRRADRIDNRTDDFDLRLERLEQTTQRRLARIEEHLNISSG